ncbi:hypothetical protein CDD81_4842 [Ophiocordyceps australis]|uniref:Uncharacterized protein n=1 Tax=Ophiocordyceps australis TaxID=1399860 RepID=A0A2C5XIV0_9HYPO|nr:hypothetical protein CDD81_4842 [Ophiocordyceps australis]
MGQRGALSSKKRNTTEKAFPSPCLDSHFSEQQAGLELPKRKGNQGIQRGSPVGGIIFQQLPALDLSLSGHNHPACVPRINS